MTALPLETRLRPDLADFLAGRQKLLAVTETTMTPGGRTVDWIPIESQLAGKVATPPPPAPMQAAQADPARPTAPVSFDLPEAGPAGHVPILRPDLSDLPAGVQLDEILSKRGGLFVNVNRTTQKPVDPNPFGYFHALSSQSKTVYGCDAWLNVWVPEIDVPSSPGDDHSISQLWLQNYQKPLLQSLEGGLTVDRGLDGDVNAHLFTFFTTNGYTAEGNNIGGYNRLQQGWVQYHPSIFPGIRINGASAQGKSPQLEIGVKYQLWQGNWWFGFNNVESGPWIWLGYYPGSLFAGGIANEVNWVAFGGEVYSALTNPCTTHDQMGSGRHAADGWTHAAYQRNLRNQTNTTAGGGMVNFDGVASVDVAASGCPTNEFTIQCFMDSGSSWGSYQYFGGPLA